MARTGLSTTLQLINVNKQPLLNNHFNNFLQSEYIKLILRAAKRISNSRRDYADTSCILRETLPDTLSPLSSVSRCSPTFSRTRHSGLCSSRLVNPLPTKYVLSGFYSFVLVDAFWKSSLEKLTVNK